MGGLGRESLPRYIELEDITSPCPFGQGTCCVAYCLLVFLLPP